MGGHVALRYMHDRPGIFSRAVLTAPMIDIWTGHYGATIARAYAAVACWIGLGTHYIPGGGKWDRATMPFDENALTRDPQRFSDEQRWLARRPELAVSGPTYGWIRATFESIDLCAESGYASGIATPTLMVSAGDERIVRNDALARFAAAMPDCRHVEIANARHEILKEVDDVRARFWAAFDDFVGPAVAPALSSVAARA
jgi:lysophospholipase